MHSRAYVSPTHNLTVVKHILTYYYYVLVTFQMSEYCACIVHLLFSVVDYSRLECNCMHFDEFSMYQICTRNSIKLMVIL